MDTCPAPRSHRLRRTAALLVVVPLVAVACGADDERAATETRRLESDDLTADESSSTSRPTVDDTDVEASDDDEVDEAPDDDQPREPATPAEDPRCVEGPGYTVTELDDVVIDEVRSEATVVEDEEVEGEFIPGFETGEVLIAAEVVDGGCIVEYDAPGGCLGAVLITGVAIPEVVIPGAEIPDLDVGIFQSDGDEAGEERSGPERVEDVTVDQECRPEDDGDRVLPPVVRQPAVRQPVVRQPAVRQPLVRQPACDGGTCVDQVIVAQVIAPQVIVDQVIVDQEIIEQVILPEIDSPDVGVLADDEATSYSAPGDVLFDFDQAVLRPDATNALQQIAASIAQRFPSGPVRVEGHTDSVGTDAYNQDLSQRRAQAVADWLVANGGIAADRIAVAGFGETAPVAPNTFPDGADDPAGRQENRRVVVTAQP